MARRKVRTTNTDLANAIQRLEVRVDNQESSMKKLQEEVAPLHESMLQIRGGVKLVSWMVGALGVVATALELWRAAHGN